MHNYTNEDSVVSSDDFFQYYCRICGMPALIASVPLENVYRRRTDESYILECDRTVHKKYLVRTKLIVLKREDGKYKLSKLTLFPGLEKQYRWRCKECNVVIGYQSYDFVNDDDMVGPKVGKRTDEQLKNDANLRKHFYVKSNAVVSNANETELVRKLKEKHTKGDDGAGSD